MTKFGIVEKQFEYKGHDCICVFTASGFRTGYVSVNDINDCFEDNISCHCGLSFGPGCLCDEYSPKDTLYIGFDCGHICDGRDYDTALKYGLISEKQYNARIEMEMQSPTFLRPGRSLEYVENQCRKIVDQLEVEE